MFKKLGMKKTDRSLSCKSDLPEPHCFEGRDFCFSYDHHLPCFTYDHLCHTAYDIHPEN